MVIKIKMWMLLKARGGSCSHSGHGRCFPAVSGTISNPIPLLGLTCTEASSLKQDRRAPTILPRWVRFHAVQVHCSTSRVYTCLAQVIVFHSDFSEEEIDIVSIFDGMKKVWFCKKIKNKPFLREDSVSVRPQQPGMLNCPWSNDSSESQHGCVQLQGPVSLKSANGL